jgi:integrase
LDNGKLAVYFLANVVDIEPHGQLHFEVGWVLDCDVGDAARLDVYAVSDPTSALRGALTAPVAQHRAAIVEPIPFGALLRAIDGYDGTLVVRFALQLLALTFTRPGELRLAAWKEFDLDAGVAVERWERD